MWEWLVKHGDSVLTGIGAAITFFGIDKLWKKRQATLAEIKRYAAIAADAIAYMIEHDLVSPNAELILAKWRDRFKALLSKAGIKVDDKTVAKAETIVYERLNQIAIDKGLAKIADMALAIVKKFEKGN